MEDFDKKALDYAFLKHLHYIDETFVIWFPGHKKVAGFLHHLNRGHEHPTDLRE
jgi:hypothetical protein